MEKPGIAIPSFWVKLLRKFLFPVLTQLVFLKSHAVGNEEALVSKKLLL